MKHFTRFALTLAGLLGVATSGMAEQQPLAAPRLSIHTVVEGLQAPWDLAFASDGSLFYTEKCLGLSVRKKDGRTVRIFGTEGSSLVASDLHCHGQSGMNGIALDPDFTKNRRIYVFMASQANGGGLSNRVVRLELSSDFTKASNRQDIVTDIPFKVLPNKWGEPGSHSGGRLRFGPDGFLYITTGDNHNGPLPQDISKLGGKVLRVDRDGQPAPQNRTPQGGDPRIFTYGHRNVQGIDFHPQLKTAYVAEHGPGHSDEVTVLQPGGNAGWDPKPEPGVECEDGYCGYISNKRDGTPTPMTDLRKFPEALRPAYTLTDSEGLGPCLFLKGASWKDWNGALAIGVMGSERLDVLQLNGKGEVIGKSAVALPKARYRTAVQGPRGHLYLATDAGQILQVIPE